MESKSLGSRMAEMLDQPQSLEKDVSNMHLQLISLPGSYAGPTQVQPAPYGALAFGEASLGLALCEEWMAAPFVSQGSQFIFSGGVDFGEVSSWVGICEARGIRAKRIGLGPLDNISFPVSQGVLGTYAYAQYLAYATGHSSEALQADQALAELATRCRPENLTENNPAKQLAWKLWTRTPILLATKELRSLCWGWQHLLARVGKSMSVSLERDPLLLLSSGFEARHESGDEHVGLILGSPNEEMELCREILETRVDEVLEVVPPEALGEYASKLYLWYLGAWTGFYLALAYKQDPGDSPALKMLLRADQEEHLN